MLSPDAPIETLEWIPRNRLGALARLGIGTVGALVRHYPRRYEDRRAFAPFPDAASDEPILLHGRVAATALKRFGGRRGVYEATIEEAGGGAFARPVVLRWFNMPYMQNAILGDQELVVFGRPKVKGRQVVMDHPEYEVIEEEEPDFSHMRRIVPIHPSGEGITPRVLRVLVWRALEAVDLDAAGWLAGSAGAAFRAVHFPDDFAALEAARVRLALDECFGLQLAVQARRARWGRQAGLAKRAPGALARRLVEGLPFDLTMWQRAALDEIVADLRSERRMHRLLQGDVGSGKTLVALAAMLHCVEAGHPAALMAPTQILAEQHFASFERLLGPLGIPVALRTGARKTEALPLLERGPGVTVGTHALLTDDAPLDGVGLVVIDEQHKFGVLQRSKLAAPDSGPDILVMTATPIPRTLAQTVYGDLDISVLRGKPAGRGEVRTVVRPATKLPEVADFIRSKLAEGRQAFIVYPLIEESEKLAAKAAAAEFDKWRELLEPAAVALIHGRTRPEEAALAMDGFRRAEIAALVSTTVIEVGVDVPNATVLLVENAERFGLAQLHQLRGRIGRGSAKSFCILLHGEEAGEEAAARLGILERSADGFVIAEEDLRLRGPGNVLGTAQSGLPPLRLAELPRDESLMAQAAVLAQELLAADPNLDAPGHERLRACVAPALAGASRTAG